MKSTTGLKKRKKAKPYKKPDALASKIVRHRGYCQIAGLDKVRCGGELQCMHIIGRSNFRLRWEMDNLLCGCAGHHVYYTHHPFEWVELVQKNFANQYTFIQQHRNELWDGDYTRVIEELKQYGTD